MLFLGIDGGGTGCRAALADRTGHILGRGESGPANINTDVEQAAHNIMAACGAALAGRDDAPRGLVAVLGLAGAAIGSARDELARRLPFARMRIVNDAVTATRGALGEIDGILAAIGTGSVFAVQRGGQIRQSGGRGFLMGDEGSGAVLGRSLLAQAMRAADGFAPMTPLLARVLEDLGGFEGIIAFGNRASPADFGAWGRVVADSDDPAATAILDEATCYIRHVIDVLQAGRRLPVVFLGGLGPVYAARLGDRPWPIRPALGNGLDGALAMARQMGAGA